MEQSFTVELRLLLELHKISKYIQRFEFGHYYILWSTNQTIISITD